MSKFSDGGPAPGHKADVVERARAGDPAKPLSLAMLDWMCRFQEGGVRMATDEDYRKAIAARLF